MEIGVLAGNMAPLLLRDIPVDQLVVLEIKAAEKQVASLARGFGESGHIQVAGNQTGSVSQLKGLMRWWAQGRVTYFAGDDRPGACFRFFLPADVRRDLILGPIGTSRGGRGILLLIAEQDRKFNSRHQALAQVLLDPFSTAMENDSRLNELAALKQAAEAENVSLLRRLGREKIADTIVGLDTGLQMVQERVRLVSRLDVPVLILGETGTGKELIAREIHNRSARSAGPFIRVNCGAIPAELIDSQLFGHEKGAFTGATETRKGWFERADGGTLFLDEIGELSLAAQVRLLRILQDGWLERVGGQQALQVNVRIIAATHRDLSVAVAENKFREDLWYRIAVFPIRLPALRERREDIPAFAGYFAERAAKRFGLSPVMPAPEQIERLAAYNWPGNVRELAAVIDRAAILGHGVTLEIEKSLGPAEAPEVVAAERDPAATDAEAHALKMVPLDEAVRNHIQAALVKTNGRISGATGAAALLKVNPSTLRARIRKLKIDPAAFRRGGKGPVSEPVNAEKD